METSKILDDLQKIKCNNENDIKYIDDLALWVIVNRNLICNVSVETFKKMTSLIGDEQQNVKAIENLMEKLSWEERLDVLQNGINNIKEQASIQRKELALLSSLMNLGVKLLPLLLMVL